MEEGLTVTEEQITKLLLRAAADNDEESLQMVLESNISPDVSNGIGQTALHVSTIHGHLGIARALLEAGADVNVANQFGVTPLHYAAEKAKVEMIKLLLAHGANKTARACNGKTPLESVKEGTHVEEMQALLGASSNELHTAIEHVRRAGRTRAPETMHVCTHPSCTEYQVCMLRLTRLSILLITV